MSDRPLILLVEDEQHLAVGIKYNLEAEGYQVSAVDDGGSALEFLAARRDEVALVILDLMLPGMSGYTVCEKMRKADQWTPVLILSARTLPEDRSRGFDVGADQYLTKPFELPELISRVKNLIGRHGRRHEQELQKPSLGVYKFGNARINFDTFEVTVGDQSVRLTPLELKLLEYFIQHQGRVIPRGELLAEVWEVPPHLSTRAPDQMLRRLRKTFEPQPSRPQYFLTIRDAGYRFVPEGERREAGPK